MNFQELCESGDLEAIINFINERGIGDIYSILVNSAEHGHLPVIEYLYDNHEHIVMTYKDAALRKSARNGHLEITRFLIERCDADIHVNDDEALSSSWNNKYPRVAHYLIERGANIHNIRNIKMMDSIILKCIKIIPYNIRYKYIEWLNK